MNEFRWFLTALLLLFIGLKLGKVLDWSWWWVLSPFWIPLAVGLLAMAAGWLLVKIARRGETEDQRKSRELRQAIIDYANALRRR